jgi:hypothetical protein
MFEDGRERVLVRGSAADAEGRDTELVGADVPRRAARAGCRGHHDLDLPADPRVNGAPVLEIGPSGDDHLLLRAHLPY